MNQLIESIEADQLKTDIPEFKVGDTISINYRIIEGAKERVQVYTGTVIGRKGSGISESILVYRIAYGSAMERMFPIHSPRVGKIEVIKRGKVRRGKLYHLRGVVGKKAKVQERILKTTEAAAPAPEAPKPEAKEEKPKEE
ncbi:MAG: 50S ribosomal protein L19 [Simkaniaceae bacterium]|nr:50S ribosomal protein L19 [Candidatus Sacchlamyda saccharinae]